mmetsp:Transcript_35840/g.91572  ORF Transcript_35840/g.91572 Transcript_35840/m.91572 type:complete len:235 (+) Transcript_35840:1356-2060(+)
MRAAICMGSTGPCAGPDSQSSTTCVWMASSVDEKSAMGTEYLECTVTTSCPSCLTISGSHSTRSNCCPEPSTMLFAAVLSSAMRPALPVACRSFTFIGSCETIWWKRSKVAWSCATTRMAASSVNLAIAALTRLGSIGAAACDILGPIIRLVCCTGAGRAANSSGVTGVSSTCEMDRKGLRLPPPPPPPPTGGAIVSCAKSSTRRKPRIQSGVLPGGHPLRGIRTAWPRGIRTA